MTGIGLKRLQHLVLWVSDVDRSVRFYCDVLGFEVKTRYPNAAFLRIAGSAEDHHLGLFAQPGVHGPDEGAVRMYHSAWEVGDSTRRIPTASSSRCSGRCRAAARWAPARSTWRESWPGAASRCPRRSTSPHPHDV